MATPSTEEVSLLASPVSMPCGRTLPNRLVKAPMEEMLATLGGGLPNEKLCSVYRHWAQGSWGMIITGNVAIDRSHLGTPFDVALPWQMGQQGDELPHDALECFRRLRCAIKGQDQGKMSTSASPALAVVQLVHAGRQSMRGLLRAPWQPALAPSAVSMKTSESFIGKAIDTLIWSEPRAMTVDEVGQMVNRFAAGARLCHAAGFDGVEIHASHGYQIAAFLSPHTNRRTDKYGGSARKRAHLLFEVIDAIRAVVPADFAVGVKLNSSDYVQGGLTEEDALQNVQWLAEDGRVDFIEISGGNYENPSFMMDNFDAEAEQARINGTRQTSTSKAKATVNGKQSRSQKREAFFQAFAQRARQAIADVNGPGKGMVLILTGGLRTRGGMAAPIAKGYVDAVGIGRMACVYPDLPRIVLDGSVPDDDAASSPPAYQVRGGQSLALLPLKILNAGWSTLWHVAMLSYLARDQRPKVKANPIEAIATVFCPALFQLPTLAWLAGPLALTVAAVATVSAYGETA